MIGEKKSKARKIILSRKGFDTSTGGIPSWIYQNKSFSIPIPEADSGIFYNQLQFNNQFNYLDVMRDLGLKFYSEAHLDPDINKGLLQNRPQNWRAAFGQHGAALSHLLNSPFAVGVGDLFLFFGWFKEITLKNGRFTYIKNAPEVHLLYGWLEIGEIVPLPNSNCPDYLVTHPHQVFVKEYGRGANCIFVAAEKSSWFQDESGNALPGAGNFVYHPDLILSHLKSEPYKRSLWELPNCFFRNNKCILSYHESREGITKRGLKNKKLLQSVARGQEFIAPANTALTKWVNALSKYIDYETT